MPENSAQIRRVADDWVKPFRRQVRVATATGWGVREMRGSIQLRQEKVGSVLLPYPWTEAGSIAALPRILQIFQRVTVSGLTLQKAALSSETASSHQRLDWSDLIARYREQRPAASDATWAKHYLPVLTAAGQQYATAVDGIDLMERSLKQWQQGSRMRQIMRRSLTGFLSWAVARQHLKPAYAPPAHVPEVLKPKRVGYPLTDQQIIELLAGIPDPRWRFAVQLCAEFGLRPEELRWLRIRDGQPWSLYRKSKGGRHGDRTEPRRLYSLPVKGADDWRLAARLSIGEPLPPLGQPGKGAESLQTYLRRRAAWRAIKDAAERDGEQLTPYSFRHRYARECHRAGLSVADISAAMGHSIQVHLGAYARFTPDRVGEAFKAVTG